ncbi:hypothetical protein [Dyadobacter diqingensis]|uniref:hypothetical protein n=1 Tax=Dyadobacter diqingensis TaxID=2938121 RepID=UPI0020C45013|nr:hypothetical protein [Dyadobacter diqingensis]
MEINQTSSQYGEIDHCIWALLAEIHKKYNLEMASSVYRRGFGLINLNDKRIEDIKELSIKLEKISGWKLAAVEGLISERSFFGLLTRKIYPITIYIRKLEEIEFSEQPDIFHDIYGHVPLLANRKFCDFLSNIARVATRNIDNEIAISYLARLYWYTFEMGLIKEDAVVKPYGGAIITSKAEINRVQDSTVTKEFLDVVQVFKTPYDPYKLQTKYFYINSFDDLFDLNEKLEANLNECLKNI